MTAPSSSSPSAARGRFQTTHWSVVACAGGPTAAASRQALTRLCELYWPPVHAYIRRRVETDDQARDLTQAFFAIFLEKNYVRDADPSRGRFRGFLLASVQHFLSNDRDRTRALKRGGGTIIVPIERETPDGWLRYEPATDATPERVFEHRWALSMVHRVMKRLQVEQESSGRADTFIRLRLCLVGEKSPQSYAELAATLGTSPGAVRVAVHRLRRRFRALLLEEIGQTVADPAEIDSEVRYLVEVLRAPDSRSQVGYA
jgi:RNA polymerase sigma-70 factor (ECF subfamily)